MTKKGGFKKLLLKAAIVDEQFSASVKQTTILFFESSSNISNILPKLYN